MDAILESQVLYCFLNQAWFSQHSIPTWYIYLHVIDIGIRIASWWVLCNMNLKWADIVRACEWCRYDRNDRFDQWEPRIITAGQSQTRKGIWCMSLVWGGDHCHSGPAHAGIGTSSRYRGVYHFAFIGGSRGRWYLFQNMHVLELFEWYLVFKIWFTYLSVHHFCDLIPWILRLWQSVGGFELEGFLINETFVANHTILRDYQSFSCQQFLNLT